MSDINLVRPSWRSFVTVLVLGDNELYKRKHFFPPPMYCVSFVCITKCFCLFHKFAKRYMSNTILQLINAEYGIKLRRYFEFLPDSTFHIPKWVPKWARKSAHSGCYCRILHFIKPFQATSGT